MAKKIYTTLILVMPFTFLFGQYVYADIPEQIQMHYGNTSPKQILIKNGNFGPITRVCSRGAHHMVLYIKSMLTIGRLTPQHRQSNMGLLS